MWSFVRLLALALVLALPARSALAASPLQGRWRTTTTLIEAQDAVNPNYRPGDKRIENWVIRVHGTLATLTTANGTVNGQKVGKAWQFLQVYDTGTGVTLRMEIVARQTSARAMKGTIEAHYFSTQWGYPIGIDSWSFKSVKR